VSEPTVPRDGLPSADLHDHLHDAIADALEAQGYAVVDGALAPALLETLFLHVGQMDAEAFSRAAIGRGGQRQLNRFVRTDEICWLQPEREPDRGLLTWMEQLRTALNRRLFLGLFDYEAHFARYPKGAFYRRHLDAFAGDGTDRVLSTVLYLNPGWEVADGGELWLYDPAGTRVIERVMPVYGRLLVFLSERFPHEVQPTARVRYSVAGWFRVNGSIAGQIDPPR
jgi:SM-20-related protein